MVVQGHFEVKLVRAVGDNEPSKGHRHGPQARHLETHSSFEAVAGGQRGHIKAQTFERSTDGSLAADSRPERARIDDDNTAVQATCVAAIIAGFGKNVSLDRVADGSTTLVLVTHPGVLGRFLGDEICHNTLWDGESLCELPHKEAFMSGVNRVVYGNASAAQEEKFTSEGVDGAQPDTSVPQRAASPLGTNYGV